MNAHYYSAFFKERVAHEKASFFLFNKASFFLMSNSFMWNIGFEI